MHLRDHIFSLLQEFQEESQYDKKVLNWNQLYNETKENKNRYYQEFNTIIEEGTDQQTLHMVEFLVYLLENEAFDFENHMAEEIFRKCVQKGKQFEKPPEPIFHVIKYLLYHKDLLFKYSQFLIKECEEEMGTMTGDFCLQLLFYILIGILNFSMGKKPKPQIKNEVKVEILIKTEMFLNRWTDAKDHLEFAKKENYSNYFSLICDFALLYSKIGYSYVADFTIGKKTIENVFHLIVRNGVNANEGEEIQVLFQLLTELLRSYFNLLSEKDVFQWLIGLSQRWILIISSVNIFWQKYVDQTFSFTDEEIKCLDILTQMLFKKLEQPLKKDENYLQKIPLAENLVKIKQKSCTYGPISKKFIAFSDFCRQNPEDFSHLPLLRVIALVLTKEFKGFQSFYEKKLIQSILLGIIQGFNEVNGKIHECGQQFADSFLQNLTAILIMIQFCWTPLLEEKFLSRIFCMFVDINFNYGVSLIKYLTKLLNKLQKWQEYRIPTLIKSLQEIVMELLERLCSNFEITFIDDIGELLEKMFSILKENNKCVYIMRICEILKKINGYNKSLSQAVQICIKDSNFETNQEFKDMVVVIVDLIIKEQRTLNIGLLIVLAKKYYQVEFVNIQINHAEEEIQRIFGKNLEIKNEINFLQYKILRLQTKSYVEKGLDLREICRKLKTLNLNQQSIEVYIKYIRESLKSSVKEPEKLNLWSQTSEIALTFCEAMIGILDWEKNSLLLKLKKILLLAKNLWEMWKNSFDAYEEEIFNPQIEENLRKKFITIKSCFSGRKEEIKNCFQEYKVFRLYLFGLSFKLPQKSIFIRQNGNRTERLFFQEKMIEMEEIEEFDFHDNRMKELKNEIFILSSRICHCTKFI